MDELCDTLGVFQWSSGWEAASSLHWRTDDRPHGQPDRRADGAWRRVNFWAKLAPLYKFTDACWCWSRPLQACDLLVKAQSLHVWKCTCINVSASLWLIVYADLYISAQKPPSVCAIAGPRVCVFVRGCVCTDAVCYLIKAVSGLQDFSISNTALELEQQPLQNKCKQLRATSVSIRQTDSSCEQGVWLTASYQIKWTCGASSRGIMQH